MRDIRTVGAQTQIRGGDNNPGFFTPFASGSDSLIVYERCIARGGGIPGSKNIGGCPGFSIFGRSNALERGPGWPSTNGLKIETKASISTSTGTPVKDCNIVGKSVVPESRVGALIHVWDSAGAVTIDNSCITNNIAGTRSVVAENPGSGRYAAPPKPWAITVKNSVIQGKQAGKQGPAIDIRERPRSIVKNICMKYPNANPSDIQGAGTSGVSYGPQCKSAGLTNPRKVGSSTNISSLPARM